MSDWTQHWLDRAGRTAGATVTSVSPEPQYGAALDVATAPLTPEQYTALMNDVGTMYEDQEEVERHGWWSKTTGALDSAMGWTGGKIGGAAGWLGEQIESGARAALPDVAVDAIGTGAGAVGNVVGAGLTELGEGIEYWDRGLATAQHALNIAEERRGGFFDFELFDGETWSDAWKRSEHTTLGQATLEAGSNPLGLGLNWTPEQRAEMYAAGFNPETGLPKNQAYADIKVNDPFYNIASGSLDFLKVWFADPLVIGGKAVGVGRALKKADLQRMPRPMRNHFLRTLTAPADEFEKIRAVGSRNPITRRAIAVRDEINGLRDQVRADGLTVPDLAEMQAFATATNGPTAAHAFYEAARAKKFDPEQGFLDEFDDDGFDTAMAAMLGHRGAMNKIANRRDEVGDSILALTETRIPALDELVTGTEKRIATINAESTALPPGFLRTGEQLMRDRRLEADLKSATFDLQTAVAGRELAEMELREYGGYADWLKQGLEDADMTMAPTQTYSVGQRLRNGASSVYRPTTHSRAVATMLRMPASAFNQLPGVADLHRAGGAYSTGQRYIDQAYRYAGDDVAQGVAVERGYGAFDEMRTDLLTRMSAAVTDSQRRSIMGQVEDIGVQTIARKHNMKRSEAEEILNDHRERRSALVAQMHQQAQQTGDSKTFTIRDSDGKLIKYKLPVTLSQLENYYAAADLKVVDQVLKRHGASIKAHLRAADSVQHAMSVFNHYWKPSVLLRLGYPLRTMADEMARVIGALGTIGTLPVHASALARGMGNVPLRAVNRTRRGFNRHILNEQRAKYPTLHETQSPETIAEVLGDIDMPDPARMERIQQRYEKTNKWVQQDLHARANGMDLKVQQPKYVTRLTQTVDDFQGGDQTFAAINPLTLTTARQGRLVTPYEGTRIVTPELSVKELADFTNEHADILSNPRAVLMMRKGEDGIEVEIGFRVTKDQSQSPVRGARFYNADGSVVHEAPELGKTIPLLRQVGEKPVFAGGEEFAGGFEPGIGDFMRVANSSAPAQASLHRSYEQNLASVRAGMARDKSLTVKDPEFASEWAKQIGQIQPDPIIRRILDGWDDDDLVDWLAGKTVHGSPGHEGRVHARRHESRSRNPQEWVGEQRVLIDQLAPTEALRARINEGATITTDELEAMIHSPGTPIPQTIDGLSVDLTMGGTVSQWINKQIERGFTALATLPTDTLIRNPFFVTNYQYRLRQMMDVAPDEVVMRADVKKAMEKRAREHALNETQKYLFSLADTTEFVHALRFLSPFAGAWQETMTRWMRIFMERPESFGRMYVNGWADMHELYGIDVINAEGEIDENGDFVRIGLPDVAKKMLGALPGVSAEDLENMTDVRIPKDSLNVTLQGDPFWLPGPGPMMQMPAMWMLQNSPHLADENKFSKFVWSWLFPIGVPDSELEAITPAWLNQLQRRIQGTNDPVFANLAMGIWKEEMAGWRGDGKVGPEPTFEAALEKAEGVQLLYTLGRVGAPFSFQFQPESQMFIDKARQYQQLYGWREGLTKFTEEVGDDAYMWWTSMSKANLDVPPTSAGFKGQKVWESQINEWPDLAGMFVGLDAAEDEFNYAVYEQQRRMPVGPDDPTPQRGHKTPTEAIHEIEALQGWQEYREFKTAVQAELDARGLNSIQQADAQDLLVIQRVFIDQQRDKLPGWGQEYDQRDIGRNYRLVEQMREALASGNVPDRPDWHGIRDYVELHDAFALELDARRVAGGSRDITARSNEDLAQMWELGIGNLASRNLMFADVYYRWLDGHELTDGSH